MAENNDADFVQPEHFAFDAESEAAIPAIIAKYPPGKQASAVMPLLYLAQNQMKRQTGSAWVPRAGMDEVARRLDMAPIRVYEVATFYLMFNLRPVGNVASCRSAPRRRAGCAAPMTWWRRAARRPASRAGARPAPTACSP